MLVPALAQWKKNTLGYNSHKSHGSAAVQHRGARVSAASSVASRSADLSAVRADATSSIWIIGGEAVGMARQRRRRRRSLTLCRYTGPLKPMQRGLDGESMWNEASTPAGITRMKDRGRARQQQIHAGHRGWSAPPRTDAGSQLLSETKGALPASRQADVWVSKEAEGSVRGVLTRSMDEMEQRATACCNRLRAGRRPRASNQLISMCKAALAWRARQSQGAATDDGFSDL